MTNHTITPLNDTITDTLGPFTKANGGALEVHNITQCAQYPFGGVFYHGVHVGAGGQWFTPTWHDTVRAGLNVSCSFGVYSHLDTVNLRHNYPPPAPLTDTIVGPAYVRPNALCRWSAAHTGGTPPLTYTWSPPGTQEDSSLIKAFSSDVWIDSYVRDSLNQNARASKRVHVVSWAPACPYAPGH